MAELYKVCPLLKGILYVMPKPGKGEGSVGEDLAYLKAEGLDIVVSLLQAEEQVSEGLEREGAVCEQLGLEFLNFPIEDHCVPADRDAAMSFVGSLKDYLGEGKNIAIHCRGGVGRTGTLAGALMLACGHEPEAVFATLSAARGKEMPATDEQRAWVAAGFVSEKRKGLES